VEKGWWFGASIDPQLEGGTLSKRHGPVSRQAVLESGVVANSCCSPLRGRPPQVWVKGGAIDFYALSDGGLQLGVEPLMVSNTSFSRILHAREPEDDLSPSFPTQPYDQPTHID